MKPSLLILAAGLGNRYGGLKQIDTFGPSGETIIDYSIFDAIRAGFGKVVFVIRQHFEKEFKKLMAGKFLDKIEVDYVCQEIEHVPPGIRIPSNRAKPWGTGHAVLAAAAAIKEPFAVANADDFYGAGSFQIVSGHLSALAEKDEASCCLVGFKLANTLSDFGSVSRAVCEPDAEGYLKSLIEIRRIFKTRDGIAYWDDEDNLRALAGDTLVSMNLMGFTPSVFGHLKFNFERFIREHGHDLAAEFYLPAAVDAMVKTNAARVKILRTNDEWFGVTYQNDKVVASKKIRELIDGGMYPENLWNRRAEI
jgi:hypothetical protein